MALADVRRWDSSVCVSGDTRTQGSELAFAASQKAHQQDTGSEIELGFELGLSNMGAGNSCGF